MGVLYSKRIFGCMEKLLDENGWSFRSDSECGLFDFNVQVEGWEDKLTICIDIRNDKYIISASMDLDCDNITADNKANIMQCINDMNEVAAAGCMYINWNEGKLYYRLTHEIGEVLPDSLDVSIQVYYVVSKMRNYSSAFKSVAEGASPDLALQMCWLTILDRIYEL